MPTIRKIEFPAKHKASETLPGFPRLTFEMIVAWVGETSFGRSQSYVGHSIFDTRRTGMTLKAHCQGSYYQPYMVKVTLNAQGIAGDHCSCPVGSHCKHVAALLQTWINEPETFIEVEALDQTLERRDKAELMAIIHQMIARYPDLELMLELPTVVADKSGQPLDAKLLRQQIESVFRSASSSDWNAVADTAVRLEPFVQLGRDYGKAGDWRTAMHVYRAVITGVTEHYGSLHDESGELHEVVAEAVDGLGEVIDESQNDSSLRSEALRALFDVRRWDIEFGGVDMGADASGLILHHITSDERRMVASWIEEAMAATAGDQYARKWRQQAFGRFMVDVRGAELSDEEFLTISRQNGLIREVVSRLLKLGRIEDAAAEVRNAEPYDALGLADLVRAAGYSSQAEAAIGKRQDDPSWQERSDEWLRQRAIERGDTGAALALIEKLFWRRPNLTQYDQLQVQAQAHGTWDTLRPEVLRRLERDKQYGLLTEVQLREGEIEQALKSLKQVANNWHTANQEPLTIRMAKAAEAAFPREALALYLSCIERLISAGGRDNARLAARYLSRVREIYRCLDELPTWNTLIAQIRDKNRRLRSLKEELERAGL